LLISRERERERERERKRENRKQEGVAKDKISVFEIPV
jgi:hypothetical protein